MVTNTGLSTSYDHSESRSVAQLELPPGFRFNPTDDELVSYYLKKKAHSEALQINVIAEVDIYKFNPWDLPGMALIGDKEWFFFSHRKRKYPKGGRPNRTAACGFWKATGKDKPIIKQRGDLFMRNCKVGVKKSLVFYEGRPRKGTKTNWIMHEYRLQDGVTPSAAAHHHDSMQLDDWVLCKIYKKSPSHAQRGPLEQVVIESTLGLLPDIDEPGIHTALAEAEHSAPAPQQALSLRGSNVPAYNVSEEDGSLTTTLPVRSSSHSSSGIAIQALHSSTWGSQEAMASTSHDGSNVLEARFVQELEASQVVMITQPMAPQTSNKSPCNYSNMELGDLHDYSVPAVHSPISVEESQGTFQTNVYDGFDCMYPVLRYDHHHAETAYQTTAGLTENSASASCIWNPNFSSYEFPASLNNFR